jgi:hypothetical protein
MVGIFDRGLRSEEPLGTALPPIADDAITRFARARHIARVIENQQAKRQRGCGVWAIRHSNRNAGAQ